MTQAVTARRAGPAWAGWAIGVPMNLALGLVGYYPMVFLWLFGAAVAQEWGWVSYDPTLTDDGFTPIVFGVVVAWLVFLPIVVGLNHAVTRSTAVRRLPYRVVAALLVVVPFAYALVTGA
ncbi:hypothetical protein AB0G02_20225 [Actinosynnema sp. NPDC023658]|uniref:hypothetical protein n=1 Tax=Actinosynnema sp. NPDC023658 TaxID=3155465 RepID=UPI0033C95D47